MCYKCQKCGEVVPPGTPRLLHIVYREIPLVKVLQQWTHRPGQYIARLPGPDPDTKIRSTRKEIAQEIPVCADCKAQLDGVINRKARQKLHVPFNGPMIQNRFTATL